MSKKFKGKTCVYCGGEGISSTGDHVFARQFFPPEKRSGLPIVAACSACNNAKSELEHYLTAVLPFGGRHPDSSAILADAVPRRLAKNQKLHNNLAAGIGRLAVAEGDQAGEHLAVPFESDTLVNLMAYVARGLAAHHWGVVIPAGYKVEAVLLNPVFEPDFRRLFLMRANARINGSVADNAFLYQGAQAVDDPALTMWRFQAFGGIVMAGDPDVPRPGAHTIWVTTAHILPEI